MGLPSFRVADLDQVMIHFVKFKWIKTWTNCKTTYRIHTLIRKNYISSLSVLCLLLTWLVLIILTVSGIYIWSCWMSSVPQRSLEFKSYGRLCCQLWRTCDPAKKEVEPSRRFADKFFIRLIWILIHLLKMLLIHGLHDTYVLSFVWNWVLVKGRRNLHGC